MPILKNPVRIWRLIADIWTLIAFAIIVEDFRTVGAMHHIIGPVMAIYIVVLAIFSAEKEFERWYSVNLGRHRGEIYVYTWTALIVGIFVATYVSGNHYKMSEEIFSAYLVVLGILAITQKSKQAFGRSRHEVE